MSDSNPGDRQSSARGDATWKAVTDGVAERNAEVRREAKRQREEKDALAARKRADADRREMAGLTTKRKK